MNTRRFRVKHDIDESQYPDLFDSINEEEDGYAVQLRLYDQARPDIAAWGEEIADSIETASMLVEAVAAEFSIPQAHIKIELRMNNAKNGTRH